MPARSNRGRTCTGRRREYDAGQPNCVRSTPRLMDFRRSVCRVNPYRKVTTVDGFNVSVSSSTAFRLFVNCSHVSGDPMVLNQSGRVPFVFEIETRPKI